MSCSCSSREQVFRLLPLVDQIVAPVKGCSWQRGRSSPTCSDDPFAITHWITKITQVRGLINRFGLSQDEQDVHPSVEFWSPKLNTLSKQTEESVEAYDTVFD